MRTSLQAVSMGLVAAFAIVANAPAAGAEPKDEIEAAAAAWGRALGEDDPDKVLPFYSADAVLWGTVSPKLRSDPAALRDYFVNAFKVLSGLKVAFGDHLIRVYGNTAVNTGYYTFTYVQNGESNYFPARYSFTYLKNGDRWMIVDHHSSAMPAPPN
jgi:hypothetical protein